MGVGCGIVEALYQNIAWLQQAFAVDTIAIGAIAQSLFGV